MCKILVAHLLNGSLPGMWKRKGLSADIQLVCLYL